jgi:hypothetical protein
MLKFFKNVFLEEVFFMKGNEASFGFFWNIPFLKMESSKLSNYQQTYYSTPSIEHFWPVVGP